MSNLEPGPKPTLITPKSYFQKYFTKNQANGLGMGWKNVFCLPF